MSNLIEGLSVWWYVWNIFGYSDWMQVFKV